MEAKELERIVASAELRNPKVFGASRERYVAEISFKAGIRKVVEWIEKQMLIAGYNMTTGQDIGMISRNQWKAKLKEWGL